MKNTIETTIGVQERRELSKILEVQYDEAIQEAVTIEKDMCEEAEIIASKKLGIQLIAEEINKLDKQKELLVKQIEEIGFDYNQGKMRIKTQWDSETGTQNWNQKTKAAKIATKVLEGTTNLIDLKSHKVSLLKTLWLTTSRKTVKKLVGNGHIAVKLIRNKKIIQLSN